MLNLAPLRYIDSGPSPFVPRCISTFLCRLRVWVGVSKHTLYRLIVPGAACRAACACTVLAPWRARRARLHPAPRRRREGSIRGQGEPMVRDLGLSTLLVVRFLLVFSRAGAPARAGETRRRESAESRQRPSKRSADGQSSVGVTGTDRAITLLNY